MSSTSMAMAAPPLPRVAMFLLVLAMSVLVASSSRARMSRVNLSLPMAISVARFMLARMSFSTVGLRRFMAASSSAWASRTFSRSSRTIGAPATLRASSRSSCFCAASRAAIFSRTSSLPLSAFSSSSGGMSALSISSTRLPLTCMRISISWTARSPSRSSLSSVARWSVSDLSRIALDAASAPLPSSACLRSRSS